MGTDATLLEPHRDATAPPPSAVVDSHPVGNYVNADWSITVAMYSEPTPVRR